MSTPIIELPKQHQILLIDDEPDVHRITKLSLKALRPGGRSLVVRSASTGKEGIELIRQHPETAVILLDVVMETDHAGLDACRAIRAFNPFVRILLQTGQPGSAPEQQTIDEYDLDGYLPKAELTSTRLYSEVRAALRTFEQIVSLERHRRVLSLLSEQVAALRSYEPIENVLRRILGTAVTICPSPLAVLWLETFDSHGNPSRVELHLSTDTDAVNASVLADEVVRLVASDKPKAREQGVVLDISLPRELGHGWLFLKDGKSDALVDQVLPMLVEHAKNAIYATVALKMMSRQADIFDEMSI